MGGCSSKSTSDHLAEQPEQLRTPTANVTTPAVAPAESPADDAAAAPLDVKPDGEEAVGEEPTEAVAEEIAAEEASLAVETMRRVSAARTSISEERAVYAGVISPRSLSILGQKGDVAILADLDTKLLAALEYSTIAIVDADWLRTRDPAKLLPSRQELEKISGALLAPSAAVKCLKAGKRKLAVLSYTWRTKEHPDPNGETLRMVIEHLKTWQGKKIVGCFWDFASLYQNLPQAPRTVVQTEQFKAALRRMGDLYASAFGTVVLRYKGEPGWMDDAAYAERGNYGERCWTNFETAVSTEITARASLFPPLQKKLEAIKKAHGPKLIELKVGERPAASFHRSRSRLHNSAVPISPMRSLTEELPKDAHGLIDRATQWRDRIVKASSHVAADKQNVLRMYSSYIAAISNAMHAAGFAIEGAITATEGLDLQCGKGKVEYPTGDVYNGEWVGGRPHGGGTYTWWDGDKYEGLWAHGYKHGIGLCSYCTGQSVRTRYEKGERRGPGLKWDKQRVVAWELLDGEIVRELAISSEDVATAAEAKARVRTILSESLGIDQEEPWAPPLYTRVAFGAARKSATHRLEAEKDDDGTM